MFRHHSLIPWGSFRGRQEEKWGSFRGRDHFGVCTDPMTSEIPLQCSTNWDLATLWAGNIPVEGEEYKWIYEGSYIWTAENDSDYQSWLPMPIQVDFTEPRVLPTRLSENMEGWRIVMVRILEDNEPFVFLRNFSTHYPAIILGLTSGELSVMTFFPTVVHLGRHGQTNMGQVSNFQGLHTSCLKCVCGLMHLA